MQWNGCKEVCTRLQQLVMSNSNKNRALHRQVREFQTLLVISKNIARNFKKHCS